MATPTQHPHTDGRLALQSESGPRPVHLCRCFPWSHPDRLLSLRNQEGEELLFLHSPDDLDPASSALLKTELAQSGALFEIDSIQSLTKEIELRCWEVTTRQGPRSFQTELDEWPRDLPDGRLLIEDLFGDLYVVPPVHQLDPASQKRIWPLLG
ncbi:MAG: DUF1854 domain-containing protein [Kiritimatiellae bacterium]|jgi:hypothetical protein|nr:DUF1854 domain-containing protein [Kiritimatiellia bacterium]